MKSETETETYKRALKMIKDEVNIVFSVGMSGKEMDSRMKNVVLEKVLLLSENALELHCATPDQG